LPQFFLTAYRLYKEKGRKVVKANNVTTDGPFVELKEMVGGYIIVKAADLDDALKFSKGCPTLTYGGTVEIRDVMVF
jgi:hypothetical protein